MDAQSRYDITGFATDLGLPMEDIAALYAELIAEFRSDVARLKMLQGQQDWQTVKTIIHDIKGISVNYRIHDLYEIATLINDRLKEGRHEGLEAELNNLFAVNESAVREIVRFFGQQGLSVDHR